MVDNYWQRRNAEMKHIQDMFDTDKEYNDALKKLYTRSQRDILKEIDSELARYAGRENLSMDEALKKISKMDVEAFSDKAKRYVKEKNFSPRANDELRAYNVKMRMNRLKLLNENIRLETISLADAEDRLLTARLDEEVIQEYTRQAGILGETVPEPEVLRRMARVIVNQEFKGTHYSNRIWANQRAMQNELEKVIERVLINGENPRVGARKLRQFVNKEFGKGIYEAERLAITESGRAQIASQMQSFEDNNIDQLEIITEPNACSQCKPYDGKIVNVSDAVQGETVPIFHPHCRCSTASVYNRDARRRNLLARGVITQEEYEARR